MIKDDTRSDVNKLMHDAKAQLDEHAAWLMKEINALYSDQGMDAAKAAIVHQCTQIKLRVAKVDRGVASVVWEYPDELAAFLRAESTPKHLRDTLAGGHQVSTEEPASTVKRIS